MQSSLSFLRLLPVVVGKFCLFPCLVCQTFDSCLLFLHVDFSPTASVCHVAVAYFPFSPFSMPPQRLPNRRPLSHRRLPHAPCPFAAATFWISIFMASQIFIFFFAFFLQPAAFIAIFVVSRGSWNLHRKMEINKTIWLAVHLSRGLSRSPSGRLFHSGWMGAILL